MREAGSGGVRCAWCVAPGAGCSDSHRRPRAAGAEDGWRAAARVARGGVGVPAGCTAAPAPGAAAGMLNRTWSLDMHALGQYASAALRTHEGPARCPARPARCIHPHAPAARRGRRRAKPADWRAAARRGKISHGVAPRPPGHAGHRRRRPAGCVAAGPGVRGACRADLAPGLGRHAKPVTAATKTLKQASWCLGPVTADRPQRSGSHATRHAPRAQGPPTGDQSGRRLAAPMAGGGSPWSIIMHIMVHHRADGWALSGRGCALRFEIRGSRFGVRTSRSVACGLWPKGLGYGVQTKPEP